MKKQFKQIEQAYCSVRPTGWFARRSFLNYYYVIFKLLELLKQHDLLPKIPLLKTKLRLRQHDALWKNLRRAGLDVPAHAMRRTRRNAIEVELRKCVTLIAERP